MSKYKLRQQWSYKVSPKGLHEDRHFQWAAPKKQNKIFLSGWKAIIRDSHHIVDN